MVEYEALVVDLEQTDAINRLQLPSPRSFTAAELATQGADPVFGTITCYAAEQDLIDGSLTHLVLDYLESLIGAELSVESGPTKHITPPDYYHSRVGKSLYVLVGLPASVFGYLRAVTLTRDGVPVPFLTAVLDAELQTGIITSIYGKSSTVLQRLKYVVRARRHDQEYESDEIDLTPAIPPEIEVAVRRKTSAKLNRKKMR